MPAVNPRAQASDAIEFCRKPAPLALFFIAVPAVVIAMIVVSLLTHRFPPILMGLLAAVGASSAFWIKTALDQTGNVVVELTAQRLRIKRLLGGASYDWSDIEAVKLIDPGASLSDSGRHEGGRVGIAIYLRTKFQKTDEERQPSEIIVTATQDGAGHVIKAGERIIAFHRKAGNGKGGSNFGKSGKGFRRPAKAA